MNQAIWNELTSHILQVLGPLPASHSHKQRMQEELLAHLLALYEEELASVKEEQAAARRAKERFGRADDLSRELRSAVPLLERLVFLIFRKGKLMKRWLWIIGCLAIYVGLGFILPAIQLWRSGGPNAHQTFWVYLALPVLGLVLCLGGLATVAYSIIRAFRARSC